MGEKEDTEKQLEEFQAFLDRTLKGDMTLIDEFGAVQLAISAAIAKAFKTPEVIRLFGEKDKQHLRDRLENITRDFKVKKIKRKAYEEQVYEILLALKNLGEKLTEKEAAFVEKFQVSDLSALASTSIKKINV